MPKALPTSNYYTRPVTSPSMTTTVVEPGWVLLFAVVLIGIAAINLLSDMLMTTGHLPSLSGTRQISCQSRGGEKKSTTMIQSTNP